MTNHQCSFPFFFFSIAAQHTADGVGLPRLPGRVFWVLKAKDDEL